MFTLNCPNWTYMPHILHIYSSSETALFVQNIKAIRQLIMDILHLKLCDLNLTFKDHKSSKILSSGTAKTSILAEPCIFE